MSVIPYDAVPAFLHNKQVFVKSWKPLQQGSKHWQALPSHCRSSTLLVDIDTSYYMNSFSIFFFLYEVEIAITRKTSVVGNVLVMYRKFELTQ